MYGAQVAPLWQIWDIGHAAGRGLPLWQLWDIAHAKSLVAARLGEPPVLSVGHDCDGLPQTEQRRRPPRRSSCSWRHGWRSAILGACREMASLAFVSWLVPTALSWISTSSVPTSTALLLGMLVYDLVVWLYFFVALGSEARWELLSS